MIKYIGSKRALLGPLVETAMALPGVRTLLDAFSGTARVGHAFKSRGLTVHANDHNAYAHILARCHVAADADRWTDPATALLRELQVTPPSPGWFTETYCERTRYFHPKNGAKIEAIRERIDALALPPELHAIAVVSLMEAADRVDSTTGVQMAYLKSWAPRAHNDLELRLPALASGIGFAHQLDAREFVARHRADVVYLDPPYNQHSYLGNYHVWETLVRWDRPEVYGVACKRIDVRTRPSSFNRKREIESALAEVLDAIDARWVLLSFSNEGYISRDRMLEMLGKRGRVNVLEFPYERYVGAKIGIYDPQGRKVGTVGHLANVEYLFVVELAADARRAV